MGVHVVMVPRNTIHALHLGSDPVILCYEVKTTKNLFPHQQTPIALPQLLFYETHAQMPFPALFT